MVNAVRIITIKQLVIILDGVIVSESFYPILHFFFHLGLDSGVAKMQNNNLIQKNS